MATSLPEFSLKGKVIVVTGAARGLGLIQAEALIEAGATGNYFSKLGPIELTIAKVCVLDLLPQPSDYFETVQVKAVSFGTSLTYYQIDVRDDQLLNTIMTTIVDTNGRIDGLIAAAGSKPP